MAPVITSEIVVAYSQCPRKAYLLLFSPDKGEPHEYIQILEQQQCANQERYLNRLQQTHADLQPYSLENLRKRERLPHGSQETPNTASTAQAVLRIAYSSAANF